MKTTILILMATVALAQGTAPPLGSSEVVRAVEIKQADADSIMRTLQAIVPGVNRNGKMIVIRGPEAVVSTLEEAIRKLDVPPPPPTPAPEIRRVPNVEFTFQLLYGSGEGSNAVPSDLESTVRQLRALFPYKNYRVMDTQVLRGRDGVAVEFTGTLPGVDNVYNLKYRPRVSPGPSPQSVRAERLEFGVRMKVFTDVGKTIFQYQPTGIITDVDAREGQKTVVGKSNVSGTDDAIILVMTPKVIE